MTETEPRWSNCWRCGGVGKYKVARFDATTGALTRCEMKPCPTCRKRPTAEENADAE